MQSSTTTPQGNLSIVKLYVVKGVNGQFFAGFDSTKGVSNFVDKEINAKKFTNKNDIKLRPDEKIVELTIDLSLSDVKISEPFRPSMRGK